MIILYIMKVGNLSRNTQCWFPHFKVCFETNKNCGGWCAIVSRTCCVPFNISYISLIMTYHAVHKSTYLLPKHGIPLSFKVVLQVIEVLIKDVPFFAFLWLFHFPVSLLQLADDTRWPSKLSVLFCLRTFSLNLHHWEVLLGVILMSKRVLLVEINCLNTNSG